jgi:hypothetical protein
MTDPRIGRNVLVEEEASANYCLRQVELRHTAEVRWEVVERDSGLTVVAGLATRDEALRVVRGWERLSFLLDGGLAGHRLLH